MANADDLLREGDLDGARSALVEAVRSAPGDQAARMFLFQLQALSGEWDKARKQLLTLASLTPDAQMLAVAYGQAIDAEAQRAEIFAGRQPMTQLIASDWAQGVADAITFYAAGRIAEGDEARGAAFESAPDTPGELDGTPFDWIADADGRFGPTFEAIINGRYGLVPFDQVESIKSEGPRDLRDVIWYPVEVAFRHGQSVAALLPTRYPGTETSTQIDERLARATVWRETPWGEAGSGQHLWSTSDGEDHALMSLRLLTFA